MDVSQPADAFRLVHPPQAGEPVKPPKPAAPAPSGGAALVDGTGPFSFESVYLQQLPRVEFTEAHERIERIRSLVAGRTDVPIHFNHVAGHSPTDALAEAYMKLTPAPADVDLRATEAAVESRA